MRHETIVLESGCISWVGSSSIQEVSPWPGLQKQVQSKMAVQHSGLTSLWIKGTPMEDFADRYGSHFVKLVDSCASGKEFEFDQVLLMPTAAGYRALVEQAKTEIEPKITTSCWTPLGHGEMMKWGRGSLPDYITGSQSTPCTIWSGVLSRTMLVFPVIMPKL